MSLNHCASNARGLRVRLTDRAFVLKERASDTGFSLT
jgi:hypothetical protein